MLYSSSNPRGLIPPHSSQEVPVYLLAKAVGRQRHSLHIAVFGSAQPPLVSLCCVDSVTVSVVTAWLLCACFFLINTFRSLLLFSLCQEVVLSCIGQGPVVHIQSPQLDFGKIPVLMDITRTLHLSNQSPIPARFTAYMVIHPDTNASLNTHITCTLFGKWSHKNVFMSSGAVIECVWKPHTPARSYTLSVFPCSCY